MTICVLLNINGYIDLWINTRLVHDLYLKSMEGHFPDLPVPKPDKLYELWVIVKL